MKTCYEVGCPAADKKTGTCKDTECIAHPNFLVDGDSEK